MDRQAFRVGSRIVSRGVILKARLFALGVLLACACGSSADKEQRAAVDASTPQTDERTSDTSCADDSACSDGYFCDLGKCVEFYEPRHYGWPCDPSLWEGADPILASKLNPCGAYICRDLRCRSCVGDEDCEAGSCNDGALREGSAVPGWGCGVTPAP